MFILVLNESQSVAFLRRPWLSITVGGTIAVISSLFGGFSLYLVAALVIPVFECVLRYETRLRVSQAAFLPAAVGVLFAHATFLAFMQGSAIGVQKLAVNIAYGSTIFLGVGIGALIFQRAITTVRLAEHDK